jgi:hypothetical protein
MSYLRGPLTRDQIASLMATSPARSAGQALPPPSTPAAEPPAAATAPAAGAPPPPPPAPTPIITTPYVAAAPADAAPVDGALDHDETPVQPKVDASVPVRWVDVAAPWLAQVGGSPHGTRYEPAIVARVALRYDETKADLVHDEEYEAVVFPLSATPDLSMAYSVDYDDRDLVPQAPATCTYSLTAAPIATKTFWTGIERGLVDTLVRARTLQIFANRDLKLYSRPGETKEAFEARCVAAADTRADADTAALRTKYETRARTIQASVNAAQDRVDVLETQAKGRRNEEILGTAGSILGGLFGGRRRKGVGGILGQLGTEAGRRSRTATSGERVDAAQNKVETLQATLADLEAEAAQEVGAIDAAWTAKAQAITAVPVALERTDVKVTQLVLAWIPVG